MSATKISFILILIYTFNCVNAQCVVDYEFKTQLYKIPITQKAKLYILNGKSFYIHSKGKNKTVIFNSDGSEWDGESFETNSGGYHQDTLGAVILKNFADKTMCMREFFDKVAYISQEPKMPKQSWAIQNEFKTIGKFKCQKAIAKFRGRNYTAWFTAQIPLNDGPWKLHGLPGLILEAADDTGEVKFLFSSIDYPAQNIPELTFPAQGKKVPFDIYRQADEIEFEEGKRKFLSSPEARGATINITYTKNNIEKEYEQ
jgi:GLPGLI family protein